VCPDAHDAPLVDEEPFDHGLGQEIEVGPASGLGIKIGHRGGDTGGIDIARERAQTVREIGIAIGDELVAAALGDLRRRPREAWPLLERRTAYRDRTVPTMLLSLEVGIPLELAVAGQ